jgi:hypothetical protein
MNLHNIKLVVMILILSMDGCTEKDDLARLVRIRFKIGFTAKSAFWESGWAAESYSFTEGWIDIQKIQFEGKREAGEDVYFETDPEINLPIIKFEAQPRREQSSLISDFDIPQGIYDNMAWDITMKKMVTDKLIAYDDTDSLDIGLVINGSYNDIWGDSPYTIRILVAIDDTMQFSLRSYPRYGNPKIVISENRDNEAILYLDLYYTFSPISRESIEEAEISSDIDGEPILIISSDKNKQLYENILYRISQSAKVYVH